MAFSIETNLGELLDNPQSRAVLDEHVPSLATHPQIAFARGMTLRAVIPFSNGAVDEEKVLAVQAAFAAL